MKLVRGDELAYAPARHENPASPGVWRKVLLGRTDLQSGDLQVINWAKLPPGKRFARHYHEDLQEVFILVRGVVRLIVGAFQTEMRPGDAVRIDPGEDHQMWNPGGEDAEFIALGTSASGTGQTVVVEAPQ